MEEKVDGSKQKGMEDWTKDREGGGNKGGMDGGKYGMQEVGMDERDDG